MGESETGDGPPVASSAMLDALRERFIRRAVLCSTSISICVNERKWHDAHMAESTRHIWLKAAEMVEEQKASNTEREVRT